MTFAMRVCLDCLRWVLPFRKCPQFRATALGDLSSDIPTFEPKGISTKTGLGLVNRIAAFVSWLNRRIDLTDQPLNQFTSGNSHYAFHKALRPIVIRRRIYSYPNFVCETF